MSTHLNSTFLENLIEGATNNSKWGPDRLGEFQDTLKSIRKRGGKFILDPEVLAKFMALADLVEKSIGASEVDEKSANKTQEVAAVKALERVLSDYLWAHLEENWHLLREMAEVGQRFDLAGSEPSDEFKAKATPFGGTMTFFFEYEETGRTDKIIALFRKMSGQKIKKGPKAPTPYEQLRELFLQGPSTEGPTTEGSPDGGPTTEGSPDGDPTTDKEGAVNNGPKEKKEEPKPQGAGLIENIGQGCWAASVRANAAVRGRGDLSAPPNPVVEGVRATLAMSATYIDSAFAKGTFFPENGLLGKDDPLAKAFREFGHKCHTNDEGVKWDGSTPGFPKSGDVQVRALLEALARHYTLASSQIEGISPFCRKVDVERAAKALKDLKPEDFASHRELGLIKDDKASEKEREAFLKKLITRITRYVKKLSKMKDPAVGFLKLFAQIDNQHKTVVSDLKKLSEQEGDFSKLYPLYGNATIPTSLMAKAVQAIPRSQVREVIPANRNDSFHLGFAPEQAIIDDMAFEWLAQQLDSKLHYEWNTVKATAGEPGHQLAVGCESDKIHALAVERFVAEVMSLHYVEVDEAGNKSQSSLLPFAKDVNAVHRIADWLVKMVMNWLTAKTIKMSVVEAQIYCELASTAGAKALEGCKDLRRDQTGYVTMAAGVMFVTGTKQFARWIWRIPSSVWSIGRTTYAKIRALFAKEANKGKWNEESARFWEMGKGLFIQFVKAPWHAVKKVATGAWDFLRGGAKARAGAFLGRARDYMLNKRDDKGQITDEREDFVHLLYLVPIRVVTGTIQLVWGAIKGVFGGLFGLFSGGGHKTTGLAALPSSQ